MVRQSARGFTLIELVAVITILGVIGFGISNFMSTGTQIYVDVTERDALLSESRFVVERLNRELRNALPNSARVAGNATTQCLEFIPVVWSTFYFDIPVAPEPPTDQIDVVDPPTPLTVQADFEVVVYPVQTTDVYDGTAGYRYGLSAVNNHGTDSDKDILVLDADVQFATDSPGSRLYVIDQPVSYCMSGGQIVRFADYGFNVNQVTGLAGGVLMAENAANTLSAAAGSTIGDPFRVIEPSLLRNAAIIAMLQFSMGEETVVFNNEVHQPNVP